MYPEKKSKDSSLWQNLISHEKVQTEKSEKNANSSMKYFYFICIIFSLTFLASVVFCFIIAPTAGKTAGRTTGSVNGVTKGYSEGAEAGKKDGLSAKDTEVKINTKMTASGNLQVLLVDLNLIDLYTQGNDYAALYSLKGEGVYTVNLEQSKSTYDEIANQIIIEIPEPVFEPYRDNSTLEIIEEYSPKIFNGSTQDGHTGFLNSQEEIDKKIQEEFCSDDAMKQAKTLAVKQVTLLAKSVCGSTASVEIRFPESEE